MAANPLSLENQLCFSVYSASHAFTRAYRPLLATLGITYPQYLVMLVLWEKRQARVSEIGQALGLDSGTLSPLLKRLEKVGLIKRQRDEGDERIVNIHLTAQGIAAQAGALDVARRIGKAIGCTAGQFVNLRDELRALAARLDAGDRWPPVMAPPMETESW